MEEFLAVIGGIVCVVGLVWIIKFIVWLTCGIGRIALGFFEYFAIFLAIMWLLF